MHALGEQLALLLGHGGGDGQDEGAQVARQVGIGHPQALGRAVDLAQGLGQDLGQHEHHHGAAGIVRHEDRHPLGLGQGVEGGAELVDQVAEGGSGGERLDLAADIGAVEAPAGIEAVLVPQIALGAGDAGGPLGAAPAAGHPRRLGPDPGDGRPQEGPGAPALVRPVLLAEGRLGEFDPALEGLAVDVLRLRQVAQLQFVAAAEPVALLGVLFDQDAAGPRVAHVQHHVDRHRPADVAAGVAQQFDLGDDGRLPDQCQQVEIVCMVGQPGTLGLHLLRRQAQAGTGPLAEDLLDPTRDPGQFRVPADLVGAVGEGIGHTGVDVRLGGGQVAQLGRLDEDGGVDGQGQTVGVEAGRRLRGGECQQPRPRPGLGTGGEAPRGVDPQQGDGQPDPVEQGRGLVHRHAQLGLDGHPRAIRPEVLAAALVIDQPGERLVALLDHELPRQGLAQGQPQAEVQELHTTPGDERDLVLEVDQFREHDLLS